MTYKIVISFIITIALGVAAWTTYLLLQTPNVTVTHNEALPDAYMEEVNAVIINKQGRPSMKIITPKMVHYAKGDVTLMTNPQLTLYRNSPQPWYVTAQYAKAMEGAERVLFWKDVNIHHSADEANPATLIQTVKLLVYPTKRVAETSDDITMKQPNLLIRATGMKADLNSGDIKLLSRTRGEYVPNS